MMKTATAIIAAALLALSAASRADDYSVNTVPTGADKLPKKGSAVYEGQFVGTGPWVGVNGPIQLFADFGTGEMSADLTIPSLGSGNATSPPEHFTPVGDIVVNGKKQAATYTLTQGVFFSPDEPFIAINGSFSGKKGEDTVGSLTSTFCVPEGGPCSGIFVIRTFSATFSATQTQLSK